MKNKKSLIIIIAVSLVVVLLAGYFIFFYEPYVPDTGYSAVEVGKLPDKIDGFDYKAAQLSPYDEEITITVAAIDYPLESNVKEGTTPFNQSFNRIASESIKKSGSRYDCFSRKGDRDSSSSQFSSWKFL